MKYQSTRGGVKGLAFKQAVSMGLADDGGLLVPETIPNVSASLSAWADLPYSELAFEIMRHYVDDIGADDLNSLVHKSYSAFDHPEVTPVAELDGYSVLELFHGPTLAFKDVALQFLGNVFEHILIETGSTLNILGATSGDTGSAAIAGVHGKANIDIYVMFPEGKTSPVQERQMTTILDENVHNIGINGSFDDCQFLMKEIFSDLTFKEGHNLAAVNSVNWARVLAQIVYYFFAWYRMGQPDRYDVSVPTGNFGNIFAAWLARRMGLPVNKLILATNSNDILARFFDTGVYARGDVTYSYSPAMDIQVASNFERYLFYQLGESPAKVNEFMQSFAESGSAKVDFNTRRFDDVFLAGSASDDETLTTIRRVYLEEGYLADPHTAVGIVVGNRLRDPDLPLLCLATAHPAKFEDAIHKAVPEAEVSHPAIDRLRDLPVRKSVLDPDPERVKAFIESGGTA
ncbi:MAG: threonine synthase [Pseudomonadales bacterium]